MKNFLNRWIDSYKYDQRFQRRPLSLPWKRQTTASDPQSSLQKRNRKIRSWIVYTPIRKRKGNTRREGDETRSTWNRSSGSSSKNKGKIWKPISGCSLRNRLMKGTLKVVLEKYSIMGGIYLFFIYYFISERKVPIVYLILFSSLFKN